MQIFETLAGEKIYIQYPGKESLLDGAKKRPYDFRPRIRTADGVLLRDLDFAYMWGLIEELDHQRHQMLKLLACVFFRLGRMTLHELVEKDYPCEVLDKDENVLSTCTRHLKWYEFTMSTDVMESINFNAPLLKIDEHTISLEAFLCFFELLLHNEDSKYYYKKKDLTSGRIPTSDSMLLLSSNLYGFTKTSVILQRFVSGFGVANCRMDEIEPATGGLVRLVDRKSELISFFDEKSIKYVVGGSITVDKVAYGIVIKTASPKVVVVPKNDGATITALTGRGWKVFVLDNLLDQAEYDKLIEEY